MPATGRHLPRHPPEHYPKGAIVLRVVSDAGMLDAQSSERREL